ncbi:hypothetical protein BX667DRAFT_526292 [Coemansia mojavensis]|nr:hypothetical protein BX667DRAFT_526292 [Coemansia mojavensis]
MNGVTDIANGLLVQDASLTASTAATLVNAVTFSTSPAMVAANINAPGISTPVNQQSRCLQQCSDMHFCSSCKKRMNVDAFQRRQNGALYNTCNSCLTKTKQRKSQQQQQRLNRRCSASPSGTDARQHVDSSQATSAVSESTRSENNQVQLNSIQQQAIDAILPNEATPSTTASQIFSQNSDTLRSQRVPGNSNWRESNRPHQASGRAYSPANSTSSLSSSPLQSRKRKRAFRSNREGNNVAEKSIALPDAYVELEYQRLELEKQRLLLEQERWREERAERMRWEQMYREQWQEDREERKAFREREQHIWRLLLTMRNYDPSL